MLGQGLPLHGHRRAAVEAKPRLADGEFLIGGHEELLRRPALHQNRISGGGQLAHMEYAAHDLQIRVLTRDQWIPRHAPSVAGRPPQQNRFGFRRKLPAPLLPVLA
ncbi:MAG TPA: hypothetical protein PKC18_09705 [Lacipirellulaceae bacterium]|nr:hypothetical protein [Lacipirellulaceae bacterium]